MPIPAPIPGPAGATGASGSPGSPGPAPSGTGLVSVTSGVLDTPTTLIARLAADADASRTAISATPGATTSDDPGDGTGWTTTPASGVTISRASSTLTLAAAIGTTGNGFVTRDASPLAVSATSWDVAVRLDVTAGDGTGYPRGLTLLGFYTDANNYSLTTLRSDRYVGLYVKAAGSFTNVAEVVGPSSGDLTGGQFWLRNTRCDDGRFVAWWGVGVGGELPTLWRRIGVRDDNSLPNALGTTTRLYVGSGAYGEGAIGSAWTVDVLAIRTTWSGTL